MAPWGDQKIEIDQGEKVLFEFPKRPHLLFTAVKIDLVLFGDNLQPGWEAMRCVSLTDGSLRAVGRQAPTNCERLHWHICLSAVLNGRGKKKKTLIEGKHQACRF